MASARKLAVEVLKQECLQCEERYDGYQVDLARRLMAILRKENEDSSSIVIDTKSEIDDLGDKLTNRSGQ